MYAPPAIRSMPYHLCSAQASGVTHSSSALKFLTWTRADSLLCGRTVVGKQTSLHSAAVHKECVGRDARYTSMRVCMCVVCVCACVRVFICVLLCVCICMCRGRKGEGAGGQGRSLTLRNSCVASALLLTACAWVAVSLQHGLDEIELRKNREIHALLALVYGLCALKLL